MPRPRKLPRILDYEDLRPYLKDYYLAAKALDPAFSFGAFARRAGIPYRNHLKLVMDGKKPLTGAFLDRYAKGLRLDADGERCLGLLAQYARARDPQARLSAREALRELRFDLMAAMPEELARALLLDWPSRLVLALTRTAGFRPCPRWISRRLLGGLTEAQAARALASLRKRGLILVSRGRLRRTRARTLRFYERGSDAFFRRLDLLHRQSERLYRSGRLTLPGRMEFSLMDLSPQEAEALAGRLRQSILSAHAPPGRRGSELYRVVMEVVPLTGGKSVTGGDNAAPEGETGSRRPSRA